MKTHKTEVIVIGAGLVGSMTSHLLKKKSIDHVVIDANHPWSASKCATGVWRSGWIEKIKSEVKKGQELLDEIAGIETIPVFDVDKETQDEMFFVDSSKILLDEGSFFFDLVQSVKNNIVTCESGNVYKAKRGVFLCAGAFCDEILTESGYDPIGIDKQWGATMWYKGKLDMTRTGIWAPYKQFVAVKRGKKMFEFSDGSMVKIQLRVIHALKKSLTVSWSILISTLESLATHLGFHL